MEKENKTVLLTGTIDSALYINTGNKVKNIRERYHMYTESIEAYIRKSVFNNIVFAENSQYEFPEDRFSEIAHKYSKQFEYVRCPSYIRETISHGKSYGEARMIEDALKTSSLLQESSTIYKITGRIFLKNSKDICKTLKRHKNEYIVYMSKKWCFTNIFKFNRADYITYWDNIWKRCDEKSGNDIERVFFKILDENPNLDVGCFSVYPYFDGIQGATLKPYSGKKPERMLRSALCKIGAFTYGTTTSRMLKL